jgi:hypothetical protein
MLDLIYPNDPEFWSILHSHSPPNWRNNIKGDIAYLVPDNNGILQAINADELNDYDAENELEENDYDLWLPSWMISESGMI